jgi:hypothetical protein
MLPRARGAGVAASGDDEFRAPLGVGPLRVRTPEVPEAALVHRAGIFTLFPLPGGHPRRFAPELDPAAVKEAEGSISLGAWRKKWHWRKEVKCWRSRGDSI